LLAGACRSLWRICKDVWQHAPPGVYAWLPDSTPPWHPDKVLRRVRWRPDVDAQLAESVFFFLLQCQQRDLIHFVTAEQDTKPDPWGLSSIDTKRDNLFGFHVMRVHDPLTFNREVKTFVQHSEQLPKKQGSGSSISRPCQIHC
jgi:hypothetical protein